MLLMLGASAVAVVAYRLATLRFSRTSILRVVLPIDTLLIAG
jgi:hypothetical protein